MFEHLFPLLSFAFSTTITPGPNNVMVTASGANFGFRRTIPHLMGIIIGFPIMIIAIGFGLGTILQKYPMVHQILKYIGIAYMMLLAYKIATTNTDLDKKTQQTKGSRPFTFLQAAAFQWVNPKAWMMALGAIATFTTLDGHFSLEVFIISMSFAFVGIPCISAWVIFGVGIRKLLRNKRALKIFNYALALLVVGSVALFFTSS